MRFKAKSCCAVLWSCTLFLLISCEQRERRPDTVFNGSIDKTVEQNIRHTLNSLPGLLTCPRKWEAWHIVISNFYYNVRRIEDPLARQRYVADYTNAVLSLDFPIDAAIEDNEASRIIGINLASYYELVECGFSMLCELDSMRPGTWDFLLESPRKYKAALTKRIGRLEAKGVKPARFRTDGLFNELRDGVQNCASIIEKGWYPSAMRRMSPSELAEVKKKIDNVFGTLPFEMGNDWRGVQGHTNATENLPEGK